MTYEFWAADLETNRGADDFVEAYCLLAAADHSSVEELSEEIGALTESHPEIASQIFFSALELYQPRELAPGESPAEIDLAALVLDNLITPEDKETAALAVVKALEDERTYLGADYLVKSELLSGDNTSQYVKRLGLPGLAQIARAYRSIEGIVAAEAASATSTP